MNEIWTLVVCLGVVYPAAPGLTQNSSRAWFLLSGPEVMHAGTPTQLAVTVFADFNGTLMVEAAHGSTKIAQTEDFQGGLTSILTLPPIAGSITQNTLVNLTVRGYRGGTVIFAETTAVSYSPRNVSTSVQTDRSHYHPGETVTVRVVSVQLDNRPYKGRVDLSVQDPSGNIFRKWDSTGNLGIVLQEILLSQTLPLGEWRITTTVNGVSDGTAFTVGHYERPLFEMLLKMPSWVLVGHDVSGSARAIYPDGQLVQGTLDVSVSLVSGTDNAASPFMERQTTELHGSTQFVFSRAVIQSLYTSSVISGEGRLHVDACVTDSLTGFKVNKTAEVHLMDNLFQLEFHNPPPTLKPSLHLYLKLGISRYDRKPLSSAELMRPAVVRVTQRTSTMAEETITEARPVPEDGNIPIKIKLQDQVAAVYIQVRFHSSQKTLKVSNDNVSPSGSYIHISPFNSLTAQIGVSLQVDVESTFQPDKLHFVVSSRGQVVDAGTKDASSFSLTPTLPWYPEACVAVYSILPDGEVASDTACVLVNQQNDVYLNWSTDEAKPLEHVTLTVTVTKPGSQVGIVVVGTHGDAQRADLEITMHQECNTNMLTNAILYEKKKHDGPKNEIEALIMIEKYQRQRLEGAESFLWLHSNLSEQTWTTGKITVPEGFASLSAFALVMSDDLGLGFTPVPEKLIVSKYFSLSLDVPSFLVRGEEIVLEVNIVSHLESDIEIIVLVAKSEAFEFVLADRGDISAPKLILKSHMSTSALFPIRPVVLGQMKISVDAVSAEATDGLTCEVFVKAEGIEQSSSETFFLEIAPLKHNNSKVISFRYPPHVIPDSQRGYVVLVGDILGLSINNLDSLVDLPLGCGEQNMIRFAPSLYVLQYLDRSTQDNTEIRSRALALMMEGYQRQLSFQRYDGSFSAFGASDPSGSIWLTAFVLRCFLQAQPYMQMNQNVLTKSMTWLLEQQGSRGEFTEGRPIHTEMQGALVDGAVALTAYVLITLLEDERQMDMHPGYAGHVLLAQTYLEDRVSGAGVKNYSLCLLAYALTLANSPVVDRALDELERRAEYRDGVMTWSSSMTGLGSRDQRVLSVQIEMASYVLLAFYGRGKLVEGIALVKWLSERRNHLGGYGTTQATVVALQALARFAAFSGANAIDLRLNLSNPASGFVSLFGINSTNYRTYQSREIEADTDVNLNIYIEGRGFAVFQMNVFYNLESKAFSQSLQQITDKEAFSLDAEVSMDRGQNRLLLSVCTRLKGNQPMPRTGMAVLDVGMLSGFGLSPGVAAPTDLIQKVEVLPDKVILYLDSVTKSLVCIRLPFLRNHKVALVQDAVVQVYDYYEPLRKATRLYNSDALRSIKSCTFCGPDCHRCVPLPPSTSSGSRSSAGHSLLGLFLSVCACFTLLYSA
ncbi:CD109 antigen-like [Brachionichthys hirsutus]|uniref:CD109 antigen-like n=1 Tax=Brachionichthys hirsutus TaxID=412623 RepID=UPI003604ECD8